MPPTFIATFGKLFSLVSVFSLGSVISNISLSKTEKCETCSRFFFLRSIQILALAVLFAFIPIAAKFVLDGTLYSSTAITSDCGAFWAVILLSVVAALQIVDERITSAGFSEVLALKEIMLMLAMIASVVIFTLSCATQDLFVIASVQSESFLKWNVFFAPLAFLVFLCSSTILSECISRSRTVGGIFSFASATYASVVYLGAWSVPSFSSQTVFAGAENIFPLFCGPAGMLFLLAGVSSVVKSSKENKDALGIVCGIAIAAIGAALLSTSQIVLEVGVSQDSVPMAVTVIQAVVVLTKATILMLISKKIWKFVSAKYGEAAMSAGVKFSIWTSVVGVLVYSAMTALGLF